MRNANLWLLGVACLSSGLAAGLLLGQRGAGPWSSDAELPTVGLPPIVADAMATAAHDNFVVATGLVADDVEGLFFLDFLTGDLKGAVINRRGPGFNGYFTYNIAADFNVGNVQNPKYLMVTGLARDLQTGGAGRMGRSVLYVVEATSGQAVVYGLPWNPSMYSANKPQRGTFIPIARAMLRTEFVRDQ
ncbi:hypothetical protein [Botrimarina sp.]|uniref:hypothetical protein n=1 Tax=Botrimarina sp. TaxID=2795802 RepID=UPI0032F02350